MNHSSPSIQTLLAMARKKRGWTQAYVAEQVDVSIDAVRRWESGRLPYPASIQKLCRLFAATPRELGLFQDPAQPLAPEPCELEKAEKLAAWELYIELVTRVPLATLESGQGILREALSSLYSLFQTTRDLLRRLGPEAASPGPGLLYERSLAGLAVGMLNTVLRPLLAHWHPLLKDYEQKRPVDVGTMAYELQWERNAELRQALTDVRSSLLNYADAFARIAGAPPQALEHTEE